MNINDIKVGFEDMKILLHMADEIKKGGIPKEEARQKMEYIKSRLLKIAMDNEKVLEIASENIK